MADNQFRTTVIEFKPEWMDSFGLVSGAYTWAQQHLQPGERVIGTRELQFAGRLDLYKFEIRNSHDKGITVECEIPARCRTSIRINHRQMLVQELDSGEIVEKYYRFIFRGSQVWRLWHRRVYEYQIERDAPAVNYNIFLLQCNQVVRELAKHCNRDWLLDVRRAVILSDMRANTPASLETFLDTLKHEVDKLLEELLDNQSDGTVIKLSMRESYEQLLQWSINYLTQRGGGQLRPPR